jgi:hypothetical protein
LDGILKEASIMLKNIKRSEEEFRKMIESNVLIRRKEERESFRMEIEEVKREENEVPTEKKVKLKMERKGEALMNEKQTYKKNTMRLQEV